MPPLFRRSSKTTNTWLIRQDETNAFNIIDNDGKVAFRIKTKIATTKSYYYLLENDTQIAQAERDAIDNKFVITAKGHKIYDLKIGEKEIQLNGEINLKSKPELRGKEFEFVNENNAISFTIDKTKLSLHDKYRVENIKSFDPIVAILVAICLDDVYHKGLKK